MLGLTILASVSMRIPCLAVAGWGGPAVPHFREKKILKREKMVIG